MGIRRTLGTVVNRGVACAGGKVSMNTLDDAKNRKQPTNPGELR